MMPVCSALIWGQLGAVATFLEDRLCELISFSGDTLCFAPYFPGKLYLQDIDRYTQEFMGNCKGPRGLKLCKL